MLKMIQPSSLDGIKRLAKSVKHSLGIQHARALDEAARQSGYQNFRHAQNALHGMSKLDPSNSVFPRTFITAYWHDKDAKTDGRETLAVPLSIAWNELLPSTLFSELRALQNFRDDGSDHLVRKDMASSQSEARANICAVARTLQFMDATKLRPSKGHSRAYPNGNPSNAVPGIDHANVWYDRCTKQYLLTDEPYEQAVISNASARAEWAARFGFSIKKPSWRGMYNPEGGSQLYLIADAGKGIELESIVSALDKLPEPIVASCWYGESAPRFPAFVTPGSIIQSPHAINQHKAPGSAKGKRSSVEFIQTVVGPRRRPNERMSIEAHSEVGNLLKSVISDTYYRKGVYNRINSVRSDLDEWTQLEYNEEELPSPKFFALYYGESGGSFRRSLSAGDCNEHIDRLNRVKFILAMNYPDCQPLTAILKKIDFAIRSLQDWAK